MCYEIGNISLTIWIYLLKPKQKFRVGIKENPFFFFFFFFGLICIPLFLFA